MALVITSLDYNASTPGSLLYVLQRLPRADGVHAPQPKVRSHLRGLQTAEKSVEDRVAKKTKKKKKPEHDEEEDDNSTSPSQVRVTCSVTGVVQLKDKIVVTGKSNFVLDFGGRLILQGAGINFAECSDFEVTRVVVDVGSNAVKKGGVDGASLDGLTFNNCQRAYVHHNELYHSTDETVNVGRNSSQVVFCNNIIALPLNNAQLHDGELHAYAAVLTSVAKENQNTMHHNLIVSCLSRMPRFDGAGLCDFSNNVIVNPGKVVAYDGPKSQATFAFYNNIVLTGPNSVSGIDMVKLNSSKSRVYSKNNTLDGVANDPISAKQALASLPTTTWPFAAPQQQTQLTPANYQLFCAANLPNMTDVSSELLAFVAASQQKKSVPASLAIQTTWKPVKLTVAN